MLITYHPDQVRLLGRERAERLLAEAEARRARRAIGGWRPGRSRRPTLDLDRHPAGRTPRDRDRAA
jgi:hypothetical protein